MSRHSFWSLIAFATLSWGCGSGTNSGDGNGAGGGSTQGYGTGGSSTGSGASAGTGGANSASGGSTSATGGSNSASGGAGDPGGSGGATGGESASPRTACPTAPPAAEKQPAGDRSLAVAKADYAQLLTQETPFVGTRGELPWHLYTPPQAQADDGTSYPLVVVLHGGYGREVTDGNIMVDVAPYLLGSKNGLLTEANRETYPTYIIMPHCRVDEGCTFGTNEWASVGGAKSQVLAEPSVAGGTALELVEHVIATFAVDPTRVYLTGNSMGGGGTWDFASRRPELFAAVFPVSGHTPADEFLDPIIAAKLPVWAFGADMDFTNPYTDTVAAISTMEAAGGCAWLTTYLGAGHDDALWSSPYLEPGLWPWLFAQSNSSAPR